MGERGRGKREEEEEIEWVREGEMEGEMEGERDGEGGRKGEGRGGREIERQMWIWKIDR